MVITVAVLAALHTFTYTEPVLLPDPVITIQPNLITPTAETLPRDANTN